MRKKYKIRTNIAEEREMSKKRNLFVIIMKRLSRAVLSLPYWAFKYGAVYPAAIILTTIFTLWEWGHDEEAFLDGWKRNLGIVLDY